MKYKLKDTLLFLWAKGFSISCKSKKNNKTAQNTLVLVHASDQTVTACTTSFCAIKEEKIDTSFSEMA